MSCIMMVGVYINASLTEQDWYYLIFVTSRTSTRGVAHSANMQLANTYYLFKVPLGGLRSQIPAPI